MVKTKEPALPNDEPADPVFDTFTSRLIRREALRRAAMELNTTSPQGLETVLERISAEVTQEAEARQAATARSGPHPSKP
jgi:hypothetical protein